MIRGADEPPLTDEQQALVRRALPMVRHWAARIAGRSRGRVKARELLGPGTLALYEAVRTYLEAQHPSFEYYAEIHVRGRMIDAIRMDTWSLRDRLEFLMERAALRQGEQQALEVDMLRDETAALKEGMRRRGDDRLAAAVAGAMSEAERPTPDEDMAARQEYGHALAAYEGALDELAPEVRAAVLLVHRDRMGLEEASQVLGVHYNTVQRRAALGLRTLEEAMTARGVQRAPEPIDVEPNGPAARTARRAPPSAPRRNQRP
jgi:RNA polymerase sigma factor (sigma-70 family)